MRHLESPQITANFQIGQACKMKTNTNLGNYMYQYPSIHVKASNHTLIFERNLMTFSVHEVEIF